MTQSIARLEDRDTEREISENARQVNEREEEARPFAETFPRLLGRAVSASRGVGVDANAHGWLSSVGIPSYRGLEALTTVTVNRALTEDFRRQRLSAFLDTGDRKAFEPPAAAPNGYSRGAIEQEEWEELERFTPFALTGERVGVDKVRAIIELPLTAMLHATSGYAEDCCEVQIRDGQIFSISYPNLSGGRVLGQHVRWAHRRAVDELRRWYAREVEDRLPRLSDLDPRLPDIRRFPLLPEPVEDEQTKAARLAFEQTLTVSVAEKDMHR